MRQLLEKFVQGLSTALCAVAGATLAVSAFDGELQWFGLGAALRVGVPAFFMGMAFFPVGFRALKGRGSFTLRALGAAALGCAAHRVLLWSVRADGPDPINLFPTLTGDGPLGIDTTMWLAILATGGTAVTAWLAQPVLFRLARQPKLSARLPPLTAFESEQSRPAARVRL